MPSCVHCDLWHYRPTPLILTMSWFTVAYSGRGGGALCLVLPRVAAQVASGALHCPVEAGTLCDCLLNSDSGSDSDSESGTQAPDSESKRARGTGSGITRY